MRIEDHEIEFHQEILVSIQGDRYMDPYVAMYLIVDDPQGVNSWGIKENKGKNPMVDIYKGLLMLTQTCFVWRTQFLFNGFKLMIQLWDCTILRMKTKWSCIFKPMELTWQP